MDPIKYQVLNTVSRVLIFNTLHAGLEAEQLENIVNVKMLDLRENKITKLPDEIHCLQSLERLDVSNNDLSALPFTLGKFICYDYYYSPSLIETVNVQEFCLI